MDEDLNEIIGYPDSRRYQELRQIILDYFKKYHGIELDSTSIDYLKDKLMGNDDSRPFFIIHNELGETKFDISKEDIQKILNAYLASKKCELSSIEYGDDVRFKYKQNPEIDCSKEGKVELDITYDGKMSYTALRQMIFDYYKENKGIQLSSISIDYLKNKLTVGNSNQPFFIRKDEFGETRFDIPQEEIQQILREYLAKKNYELIDLTFGSSVEFKYKQRRQQDKKDEQEKSDLGVKINESGEISRDGFVPTPEHLVVNDIPRFEPPKKENDIILEQTNEPKKTEPIPVHDEMLERMAREKRKFTILQRERAMSEAQKGKNRSAIMAGLCILGAAVAVYFNGQDAQQVLEHELNVIYSWKALGQYVQDLGPLTTLLAASTCGFIAKYFKYSRKFKQAQNEFIDFNNSLESVNTEELGGNENAKSR